MIIFVYMDKLITITIGTHFFKLTNISPRVRKQVIDMALGYVRYGLQTVRRNEVAQVALAVYAGATKDREEFRFHINQFDEFMIKLKLDYVPESLIEIIHKPIPEPKKVCFNVKPMWVPREVQVPIIDYLTADEGSRSRFVGLQTGSGKTAISLLAVAKIGFRLIIIIRPMYIGKWTQDLSKYYDIKPERIMAVQGLGQLQALFMLAKNDQLQDTDAIIVSNKTMQIYIKLYEQHKESLLDLGYETLPENFFETLQGIRLIDEVHQDFHLNFKLDLYTNVYRSISLSATLINRDPFMERVYEVAYPTRFRYKDVELDKYIDSFSIHYRFRSVERIRASERSGNSYSHNAFEESLLKHRDKTYLLNYFKLIKFTVEHSFMQDYKPGERLIIFCYRTDFCQYVVDFLQKEYPKLNIKRFTADDPDENMYESDIRVTTLGSGSTAHDVARLKAAILTVAVDSVQSNVQALGRLRKLPDMAPRFYFLVCDDIPKHRQYAKSKEEMLRHRAKSFKAFHAPFIL